MREPSERLPTPAVEFEPFLTAREVAERLRIAPCTVLRYYDEGVLPGRRLRRGPRRRCAFAGARSRRHCWRTRGDVGRGPVAYRGDQAHDGRLGDPLSRWPRRAPAARRLSDEG